MSALKWIRMRDTISGGRHDGRPWPPAHTDFQVPAWEANDLLRGGLAYPGKEPVSKKPEPPEYDLSVPEPKPLWEKAREPAADPGLPPPPAGKPAPSAADSKQRWMDYAVSQGGDPDDVTDMTKAQLMQTYGGRL
jgi:hypothetical protein